MVVCRSAWPHVQGTCLGKMPCGGQGPVWVPLHPGLCLGPRFWAACTCCHGHSLLEKSNSYSGRLFVRGWGFAIFFLAKTFLRDGFIFLQNIPPMTLLTFGGYTKKNCIPPLPINTCILLFLLITVGGGVIQKNCIPYAYKYSHPLMYDKKKKKSLIPL